MSEQIETPPEVWWSPTLGVMELAYIVGDQAVYRKWAGDSGDQEVIGLPPDAVELIQAPSEEECERLHDHDLLHEQLLEMQHRARVVASLPAGDVRGAQARYILTGQWPNERNTT